MPATSEKQRRLMCLALSMKQGLTPKSKSKQAAELAETMSEEQLKEFCGSKVEE
jgi:hypothetical protein